MLLNQVIEDYIASLELREHSKATIRGYSAVLKDFNKFLETKLNCFVYVDEISQSLLEEYMTYRKDNGDQPISRNRHLYIIRAFYTYMIRMDHIEVDISRKIYPIKCRKKERNFLSSEEVDELIDAIQKPLIKIIIFTLFNTGLRISELTNLKLNDVDFNFGIIRVIQGKGNKDRIVPINDELRGVLLDYRANIRPLVDSDRFFMTHTGKISNQYVNQCISAAVEKLEWDKQVSAHVLRHSFASALIKNNAPLSTVQSLLGHSDIRITGRYIHQNMDDLQEAVNLISKGEYYHGN